MYSFCSVPTIKNITFCFNIKSSLLKLIFMWGNLPQPLWLDFFRLTFPHILNQNLHLSIFTGRTTEKEERRTEITCALLFPTNSPLQYIVPPPFSNNISPSYDPCYAIPFFIIECRYRNFSLVLRKIVSLWTHLVLTFLFPWPALVIAQPRCDGTAYGKHQWEGLIPCSRSKKLQRSHGQCTDIHMRRRIHTWKGVHNHNWFLGHNQSHNYRLIRWRLQQVLLWGWWNLRGRGRRRHNSIRCQIWSGRMRRNWGGEEEDMVGAP